MPTIQVWSRVGLFMVVVGVMGCGGGVQLVKEGERQGVVQYLYKGNDGHLLTPRRTAAFETIRKFCKGPYQVVREGQTKGRQRVVEGVGGSDVIVETWWGIRFQCSE